MLLQLKKENQMGLNARAIETEEVKVNIHSSVLDLEDKKVFP